MALLTWQRGLRVATFKAIVIEKSDGGTKAALANFDEAEPNAVIAPFGSGCSTIVYYPYLEGRSRRPRAVIGLFDVSARPAVSGQTLAFSVPMPKFVRMVRDVPESFLTTESWDKVRRRIAKENVA